RSTRAATHPDQQEAIAELADAYGGALGRDVRVVAHGAAGYRVELVFETADEALALVHRLRGGGSA
ncbi:MAG: hypothetical protein WBC33_03145, partial [Conexibacter sp.]